MTPYSLATCPPSVKQQLDEWIAAARLTLSDILVGIYLHGSLAMGCFNPSRSDLDLLVITQRGMTVQEKRRIAVHLLRISRQPSSIEVSFLAHDQICPWRHPSPYDFHFSETWRAQLHAEMENGTWTTWNDEQRVDPDLAAHVTIVHARGETLYGNPIEAVFPPVPAEHYIDSILSDWVWSQERAEANPVYAILNGCRIYAYLRDGLITSKQEAGEWALQTFDDPYRDIIQAALDAYQGSTKTPFAARAVKRFLREMDARIRAFVP